MNITNIFKGNKDEDITVGLGIIVVLISIPFAYILFMNLYSVRNRSPLRWPLRNWPVGPIPADHPGPSNAPQPIDPNQPTISTVPARTHSGGVCPAECVDPKKKKKCTPDDDIVKPHKKTIMDLEEKIAREKHSEAKNTQLLRKAERELCTYLASCNDKGSLNKAKLLECEKKIKVEDQEEIKAEYSQLMHENSKKLNVTPNPSYTPINFTV